MKQKEEFQGLNNPLFKKIDSKNTMSIRGGYTQCWTGCSDTAWGLDSRCTDNTKDADPQK
jgi:hypothetical protein